MKSNKDIVKQCMEALWNKRDMAVIDKCFSDNAEIHSPMRTVLGKESMLDVAEKWFTAFPDMKVQWDEFIAEGDKVVCRFTADATHLGGFFETRPTYKEVHFTGIIIFRLEDSMVVDYWSLVDIHAILSQLEEYATMEEALES